MEQQQQAPATAEKSPSPPATTPQTFDKGRITAIYFKPFDEWTEEEAAYVQAFQEEEKRKKEERKRKEAERKAKAEEYSRNYWQQMREMDAAREIAEQGGTMEWFIDQAMRRQVTTQPQRITNHTDKTPQYLAMAYKMEVVRLKKKLYLCKKITGLEQVR